MAFVSQIQFNIPTKHRKCNRDWNNGRVGKKSVFAYPIIELKSGILGTYSVFLLFLCIPRYLPVFLYLSWKKTVPLVRKSCRWRKDRFAEREIVSLLVASHNRSSSKHVAYAKSENFQSIDRAVDVWKRCDSFLPFDTYITFYFELDRQVVSICPCSWEISILYSWLVQFHRIVVTILRIENPIFF